MQVKWLKDNKLGSGCAMISTQVSQIAGDRMCPGVDPQHNVQRTSGVGEKSVAFGGRR